MSPDEPGTTAAAEAALAAGKVEEAARLFREALAKAPDDVAALVGLARTAILIARLDEAEKLLGRALAIAPANRDALTFAGVLAEGKGKLEDAIAKYRAASERDPEALLPAFHLGRALGVAKRYDEAAAALGRAAALDPAAHEVRYALGICEQERGRTDAALEAFAAAIEANPAFLDGYLTLADVLCAAQRFPLAEKVLEQAASLFPRSGLVEDKLAAVAFRSGDLPRAVRHLERRVDLEPQNARAYLNLSTFAQLAGDMARAERAAERLAAVDPRSAEARFHLGSIYEAVGLHDRARTHYRAAMDLDAKDWRPRSDLGRMLVSEKDRAAQEEGAKLLEEAARLAPAGEPAPRLNLALARLALGERKKAAALLKDLAAKTPAGHRLAAQIRDALDAASAGAR